MAKKRPCLRRIKNKLDRLPNKLVEQKKAYLDLVEEVTNPKLGRSTIPLTLEELEILKDWAREYNIFVEEHLDGHMSGSGKYYSRGGIPPHIHIDITGKKLHGSIHYLVAF